MVNQAALTGEAMPVRKTEGSTLYAGTVVEEGECVFIAKAEGGSNRYDKIVAMIEESEKLKSSTENRALVLADKLVPWCLGATVVTYLLTRNATRAISCLMVDFSCALKLSMPLAVLSAMRECGSYHITVKGGKYLEALSKADTIVFDKTGTLTRATPQVVEVVPFSGCNEREVLQLAACLEEHFPHSMANAVVRAAKERGISHEEMHSRWNTSWPTALQAAWAASAWSSAATTLSLRMKSVPSPQPSSRSSMPSSPRIRTCTWLPAGSWWA